MAEPVVTSDTFRRPTDVLYSSGNPEKAKRLLGWSATTAMPRVIELLIEAERARRVYNGLSAEPEKSACLGVGQDRLHGLPPTSDMDGAARDVHLGPQDQRQRGGTVALHPGCGGQFNVEPGCQISADPRVAAGCVANLFVIRNAAS